MLQTLARKIRLPRKSVSQTPGPTARADATNEIITGTVSGEPVTGIATLWQTALNRYISRLPQNDQKSIVKLNANNTLTQQNLETILEPIRTGFSQAQLFQCLSQINPIVNHVRSFAVVLDVAIQSNPNPATLIWGCIKLLLEISSRSIPLFTSICGMLGELSALLPLFERWLRLFPATPFHELSEAITETFFEYLSFLVDAVLYFRSSALWSTLRVVVSPAFEQRFQQAAKTIRSVTANLVLQVHTASMEAADQRHKELVGMLASTMESPAHEQIEPRLPYHFLQHVVRNDRFFGREDILSQVLSILNANTPRTHSVALYGLGGVGKTQVATEFVYRNLDRYKIILWLHADSTETLKDQFVVVARNVGFAGANPNQEYCCEAVLHWLCHTTTEWLLVFDGADNVSILRSFWPACSRGSILVTSRSPQSTEEGLATEGVQIQPFGSSDGNSFLLSVLGRSGPVCDEEQRAVKVVAELFHGLPLGLRAAGAFMKNKSCTAQRFLALYSERLEDVERSSVPGSLKTLENVWDMSLNALSPEAKRLLEVLVFFDGYDIPLETFETNLSSATIGTPNIGFREGLESLSQHSLVNLNDSWESMSIHKYFQDSMMRRLQSSRTLYTAGFTTALEYLCKALPPLPATYMGRRPEGWPIFERYLAHMRSLASRIRSDLPPEGVGMAVDLLCRYGSYFYETSQYHFGFETIRTAIDIGIASQTIDPRVLAHAHYIHAYLNLESNRPEESSRSLVEARSILDKVLIGVEPLSVQDRLFLIAINSLLGNSFTGLERFSEAEEALQNAISIATAGGDATSGKLGTLYANLGSCLLWKGDLDAAEAILHRSLLQHQRQLNCNMYALGNVYLRQKRYEEAYNLHVEVLGNFSRTLGHDHHATADSCHKVGAILAMDECPRKDLSEAEAYFRKALAIYESSLKKGCTFMGPSIARTQWKLATTLQKSHATGSQEITTLLESSKEYITRTLNMQIPTSSEIEAERFYDGLVFFWSR